MRARSRAALAWLVGAALQVPLQGLLADPGLADHGGPLRDAPMSPLTLGLIAGGLALAVGLVVVALVSLLSGKGDDDDA